MSPDVLKSNFKPSMYRRYLSSKEVFLRTAFENASVSCLIFVGEELSSIKLNLEIVVNSLISLAGVLSILLGIMLGSDLIFGTGFTNFLWY